MNRSVEIMKDFIEASWRGYELRRALTAFYSSVRVLQRAFRTHHVLMKHIRRKILYPVFWEAETIIIGPVAGVDPAILEHEIEATHHHFDLPKQRRIAKELMNARNWMGHEEQSPRHGKAQFHMGHEEHAPHQDPPKDRKPRISQGAQASVLLSQHLQNTRFIDEMRSKTPEPRDPYPMMTVVDQFRIPEDDRNEIISKALQKSRDRWWVQYQEYKKQREDFKLRWQQWRLDVAALGPYHRKDWPAPPPIPRYPQQLLKVDEAWMKQKALSALKRSKAGQMFSHIELSH